MERRDSTVSQQTLDKVSELFHGPEDLGLIGDDAQAPWPMPRGARHPFARIPRPAPMPPAATASSGAALLDVFARSGRIAACRLLFDRIPKPDPAGMGRADSGLVDEGPARF